MTGAPDPGEGDPAAPDLAGLEAWIAAHLPDHAGPLRARKIPGGQSNPTYLLETGAGLCVLRRKPPGVLLKSAHAVEREFRVQAALAGTGVPVAGMLALCADPGVIGTAFYLMEHVAGRCFEDPRLPGLPKPERGAALRDMARVLAAIHSVRPEAVGLGDFGPKGAYFRRQIDRWTGQYRATRTGDIPEMEALMAWLDAHCPAEDGRSSLVHGDYRLDNLIFAPDRPRIRAVLDWELSTLGHPFADLAGVIMQWRMPAGDRGRGLAGVDRAGLGLPSEAEFLAWYCADAGIEGIEGIEFHIAFCFFRMAAILQGVKRRALEGNASDPERGRVLGAMVPDYARGGLLAAERWA